MHCEGNLISYRAGHVAQVHLEELHGSEFHASPSFYSETQVHRHVQDPEDKGYPEREAAFSTADSGTWSGLEVMLKNPAELGMLKSSNGIVIRSHRISKVPSNDHVS